MAMLVASPLVLPRSDGGSASEHSGLSTHLSSARAEPRRDIFASAIAQAEQGQSISALARLTANPITFVEASDPQPSSLPISGKYEVLDDSKLPGFSTAQVRSLLLSLWREWGHNAHRYVAIQARSFIGPVIPSHLLGTDEDQLIASSTQTSSPKLTEDPAISTAVQKVLYTREIPSGWPQFSIRSPRSPCRGLDNVGNTCFLNSVLQCLLHTQGLLHIIIEHRLKDCPLHANGFCMMCQFSELAWTALYSEGNKLYVRPASILNSMGKIAKGLKRGRQEDAHEFLRLSIDAFQRAALAGTDP
jgi:ubiquitin carboxyl-terminal hydrolase 36/42